ncbi:immunoglobulin-like domain-containing protein [Vibrio sp. Isolate30]|uniref:immunoglobulin-like domain-containing protein n=1 Tax=Vibrio sp. Isolate30 TaxID=2908536 RepID=UPI001EFE5091|nr:immunoglobulin-like domain-containing protein [Vibrio sp. Isolate30]MCG9631167.1 glycosyl hydrolase family 18 protein [Vibrio sp. Isolate30]
MMKRSMLQLAISMGMVAVPSMVSASSTPMTNPDSGVVVGYWHNWCDGSGYQGGNAPCVTLDEVNPMYNIVNVSFMKVYNVADGRIPTFKLDPTIGLSEEQFIDQISDLNKQGRSVLLALGGADAHIELKTGDERAFADEIIRLTERYGFDGLDIDLEQAAVTAANNQTVIPDALKLVKEHYRAEGKNFLITMAPEFPYLTTGGKYVPYIDNLEGYYDWINPQFYNQGGDGIWVDGVGWIAQNNDELKEEFIYYISDSLSNGTRGFHKIPHDKLVFGIPSSIDAAATGFVKDPQDLYDAFTSLTSQGQPLRGVMTWSINWDMGTNKNGQQYNEQFIKDYGPFVHGQVTPPPVEGEPIFKGIENARVLHNTVFDPMAGVTATDKEDGDLTSSIDVEGYVETSVLGTYILTYRVKDTDNNETTQARTVEIYSQKPVFDGVSDTTVALGAAFDPMAGVSASDAEDGDLTSSIVQTGSADVNEVGNYTLVYRVTDSANQTTTAERKVSVTDGSSCANAWNSETVYIEGDQVSHNGSTWKAGWWTRGEEPGTTGEWGVWSKVLDSSCGGETPDPDVDPTLSVTGLASSYALNNGQVTLSLQLVSNETLTVDVSVRDASNKVVEQSQTEVNGQSPLTIELQGIEAGTFQLLLEGVADDGEMVSSQNSFSVTDETTTPPPGEYPDYVAGTAYQAGDRVIGGDNGVYECKPWPYTAWCASASYAPGDSLYWKDAWTKL